MMITQVQFDIKSKLMAISWLGIIWCTILFVTDGTLPTGGYIQQDYNIRLVLAHVDVISCFYREIIYFKWL